jgi:hypothetical protein
MPRWIYTAPPDSCAKSEQAVAAFFSALGPEFSIRWGFPYEDKAASGGKETSSSKAPTATSS